jgi:hypothetical protein
LQPRHLHQRGGGRVLTMQQLIDFLVDALRHVRVSRDQTSPP